MMPGSTPVFLAIYIGQVSGTTQDMSSGLGTDNLPPLGGLSPSLSDAGKRSVVLSGCPLEGRHRLRATVHAG